MKYLKRVFALTLLLATSLALLQSSYAQAFNPFNRPVGDRVGKVCQGTAGTSVACKNYGSNNPFTNNDGVLIKVALLISWIIGIASVAIILYAGLQFMMSRGDAQKAANARNTILYASLGLVVAVASQAIIAFVLNRVFK